MTFPLGLLGGPPPPQAPRRPLVGQGSGAGGLIGGGSPYGAAAVVEQGDLNNPAQVQRAIDRQRRGTADLTLDNLAKAGRFALGIASGTGPVKLGAGLLANQVAPGTFSNPMPQFTGSVPGTIWGKELVKRGTPLKKVQEMERYRALGGTMGGKGEQRGPGGGMGGSYGANDPTSKGPGGTLGHI